MTTLSRLYTSGVRWSRQHPQDLRRLWELTATTVAAVCLVTAIASPESMVGVGFIIFLIFVPSAVVVLPYALIARRMVKIGEKLDPTCSWRQVVWAFLPIVGMTVVVSLALIASWVDPWRVFTSKDPATQAQLTAVWRTLAVLTIIGMVVGIIILLLAFSVFVADLVGARIDARKSERISQQVHSVVQA